MITHMAKIFQMTRILHLWKCLPKFNSSFTITLILPKKKWTVCKYICGGWERESRLEAGRPIRMPLEVTQAKRR